MVDDRPYACSMARFAVDSAFAGLELVGRTEPHEEQAFFLSMGLITNTRAVFFALVNRDAKKSVAHKSAIDAWRKNDVPELRRFKRIIVTVRDQFTKEFASTPLVVTTTSNYAPPTYEIPIYIPFSPEIDEVLTQKERSMRRALSRGRRKLDDAGRSCKRMSHRSRNMADRN